MLDIHLSTAPNYILNKFLGIIKKFDIFCFSFFLYSVISIFPVENGEQNRAEYLYL